MITLKQYKGLTVDKRTTVVNDRMVEAALHQLLEQQMDEIIIKDRMTETGDIAVIDFEGFVDGVAFDGGKAEKYELVLGSGSFIPGFEEQVVGHMPGESFDVNVKFPENYNAGNLAGKDSVFKIVLHEIKQRKLPELNNDFAKKFGIDTVEELKEEIRKQQEIQSAQGSEMEVTNLLLMQLISASNIEGEIDPSLYENEIDMIVSQIEMQLSQQNMTLEQYLQLTKTDLDSFRNGYREEAEKQVKIRTALKWIAEQENIDATDEEVNNEYEKLARIYNYPVEEIKSEMPFETLKQDVIAQKALLLVRDTAVVSQI